MRKERKHYSAEEKVAILRLHLLDSRRCEPRWSMCFSDEAEVWIREDALSRPEKNAHRLLVTCAPVNLFVSRKKLLLGAA